MWKVKVSKVTALPLIALGEILDITFRFVIFPLYRLAFAATWSILLDLGSAAVRDGAPSRFLRQVCEWTVCESQTSKRQKGCPN